MFSFKAENFPKKLKTIKKLENCQNKKKNLKNFTLKCKDITLKKIFCKSASSYKMLNEMEQYIKKKLNIEYMLLKYNEIDNLKKVVLDELQLKIFNQLPKQTFDCASKTISFATTNLKHINHSMKDNYELLKHRSESKVDMNLINLVKELN